MKRKLIIATLALIAVIAIVLARAFWPLPPVTLVVSPETTYFTEPLRADGTVDYVAAYNQHVGGGVRPEDNLAVPLLEMLGPDGVEPGVLDALTAELELEMPPKAEQYVRLEAYVLAHIDEYRTLAPEGVSDADLRRGLDTDPSVTTAAEANPYGFARRSNPLVEVAKAQLERALAGPWTPEELPIVAGWLRANAGALERIEQMRECDALYIPLVATSPSAFLLECDFGFDAFAAAEFTKLLAVRSMHRLAAGAIATAWDDALLLQRIGRTWTSQPGLSALWGIILAQLGAECSIAIAQHGDTTAARFDAMLAQLDALPQLQNVSRDFVLSERVVMLSAMQALFTGSTTLGVSTPQTPTGGLDVNAAMRRLNGLCDEVEQLTGMPDLGQRFRAIKHWEDQFPARIASSKRVFTGGVLGRIVFVLSSAQQKRDVTAAVLADTLAGIMFPSPTGAARAQAEYAQTHELARVAMALARYRAELGQFPADLQALVPDYLPAPTKDVFSGQPLHYESDGRSYRLWSIGEDGIDDGGDAKSDLVIETSR